MPSGGDDLHAAEAGAMDAGVLGGPAIEPTPRRPLKWVVAFALAGLVCACIFVTGPGPSLLEVSEEHSTSSGLSTGPSSSSSSGDVAYEPDDSLIGRVFMLFFRRASSGDLSEDSTVSTLSDSEGLSKHSTESALEQNEQNSEAASSKFQLRSEAAACLQGNLDQLDPFLRDVAVAHLEYRMCIRRISDQQLSGESAALAVCENMTASAMQTCLSLGRQRSAKGDTAWISQCDASTIFRRFDAATFFDSKDCLASWMSIAQQADTMSQVMKMDADVAPMVVAKFQQAACLEDTAALTGIFQTNHFCGFVDAAHQGCLQSVRARDADEGVCDPEVAGRYVQPDDRAALAAIVKYGWCRSFFEGEQASVCSTHLLAEDGVVVDVAAVLYKYSKSTADQAKVIHWFYADACYSTAKYSAAEVSSSCAWAGKQIQIEDGPCEENFFTFDASYGMGQLPTRNHPR